ncbi:MAG: DUF6684 family protein [Halanaeroarchaeum sp.]
MTDERIWTTDTFLDVSVNVVPLIVLAAFLLLFVGGAYWGMGLTLLTAVQGGLVVVPGVILAYLTYVAAEKIEG